MVGESAGDGVADVVEAGLSQLTVAAVVSFDSTELTSTRTDSLSRFFSQALHIANAFGIFNVGFCVMFSEKTHCGWLMKIFIHQHELVVYYNSQICDEN